MILKTIIWVIILLKRCNYNFLLSFTLSASPQTLQCQLTGGTSCPTMICPNTAVNYICNVGSYAGKTEWKAGACSATSQPPFSLSQGPPGSGQDCLTTASLVKCGPFTATNTPPFINNIYCLISTLSFVVTQAMNGLVVECSSFPFTPSFTATPIGNATISLQGKH